MTNENFDKLAATWDLNQDKLKLSKAVAESIKSNIDLLGYALE
jgi:hypothetical protein